MSSAVDARIQVKVENSIKIRWRTTRSRLRLILRVGNSNCHSPLDGQEANLQYFPLRCIGSAKSNIPILKCDALHKCVLGVYYGHAQPVGDGPLQQTEYPVPPNHFRRVNHANAGVRIEM